MAAPPMLHGGTFYWQDEGPESVTVTIPFQGNLASRDMDVKLNKDWIKAGIKNQPPALEGRLFQKIDVDESMWQIERKEQLLTLHLFKETPSYWPIVVAGPVNDKEDRIDKQSIFLLGDLYETGKGVMLGMPANGEAALKHYAKAAAMQFTPAMIRLAELYTPDLPVSPALEGVEKSSDSAKMFYTKAAELGNAWAQAQLALAYYDPTSLGGKWQPDFKEARSWGEKAAALGSPEACYLLGQMAESTIDGAADHAQAAKWYKEAGPLPKAMHQLAWLQARGLGGFKKNKEQALQLFERARKLDNSLQVPTSTELDAGSTGSGLSNLEIGACAALGAATVVALFLLYRYRRASA